MQGARSCSEVKSGPGSGSGAKTRADRAFSGLEQPSLALGRTGTITGYVRVGLMPLSALGQLRVRPRGCFPLYCMRGAIGAFHQIPLLLVFLVHEKQASLPPPDDRGRRIVYLYIAASDGMKRLTPAGKTEGPSHTNDLRSTSPTRVTKFPVSPL